MLYTILCGYQPFYKQYVADLIETIKQCAYDFEPEVWTYISGEAKLLIRGPKRAAMAMDLASVLR